MIRLLRPWLPSLFAITMLAGCLETPPQPFPGHLLPADSYQVGRSYSFNEGYVVVDNGAFLNIAPLSYGRVTSAHRTYCPAPLKFEVLEALYVNYPSTGPRVGYKVRLVGGPCAGKELRLWANGFSRSGYWGPDHTEYLKPKR